MADHSDLENPNRAGTLKISCLNRIKGGKNMAEYSRSFRNCICFTHQLDHWQEL